MSGRALPSCMLLESEEILSRIVGISCKRRHEYYNKEQATLVTDNKVLVRLGYLSFVLAVLET